MFVERLKPSLRSVILYRSHQDEVPASLVKRKFGARAKGEEKKYIIIKTIIIYIFYIER